MSVIDDIGGSDVVVDVGVMEIPRSRGRRRRKRSRQNIERDQSARTASTSRPTADLLYLERPSFAVSLIGTSILCNKR